MKTSFVAAGAALLIFGLGLTSCKEACEKNKRSDLNVRNGRTDSVEVYYYGSYLGLLAPDAQATYDVPVYDYRSNGDLSARIHGCQTPGSLLNPSPCEIKATPKILPCEPYTWNIH